ncbi:hypothetical protein G3570_12825 [Balneolaceae bacterium YR4-1]|uniref:Uncharacterized protein n=1 Tax=Halalkalibaculum roseum TaxID=2709311 RepID=A0A6M1T1W3_9BACT|nr:hypothetical protein [Halalkalibaculum roseum]NGP77524.1 hypothetical protein [Halalkalibaculum roseum]
MNNPRRSLDWLWQLPLTAFILAGLTGFLYRLGLIGVDLWGLSLEHIRHAHSHLMFFCWAVPLPMYLIIKKVNREIQDTGSNILMTRMAIASLFLGFASYPFFLLYGYRPVPLAGMELPVSVMLSGLVMLCWYGFMAGYWKERKFIETDLAMTFYDASLLMLFISSLGAWGVAVVQFLGLDNPLYGKALTHFFLATFTEGWVVTVLLGIVYDHFRVKLKNVTVAPGLLAGLILFGAPLTFPYGISETLLTGQLLMAARLGGLLAVIGLALNLFVIVRQIDFGLHRFWKLILGLFVLKAIAQLLASVLPSEFWMSAHSLRIFYMHLLLLGAFSLTLFTVLLSEEQARTGLLAVSVGIILVLISLIWLTPLWPQAWSATWQFYTVTGIAILPSMAAVYYFVKLST